MSHRGTPKSQPPLRRVLAWAALSFLMAATAGTVGYLVAGPAESASAEPPVPRLLQVDDIFSAGLAEGRRSVTRARALGRRAGYRKGLARGRRFASEVLERRYRPGGGAHQRIFAEGQLAGERRTLGRFDFEADGFYLVGVAEGGRRVDARHGPLPADKAYAVCRAGRAICVSEADR